MVVYGFKMSGTTDIRDIDLTLAKVKEKIQSVTNRIYGELLGEEAALICDNLTLNVLQRFDNKPIIEVAKEALDKKLRTATMLGALTKYNLAVYVNVMTYEDDAYLKVTCSNQELLKAFHVKELKDCSLSESEHKDQANPKRILWETLHGLYNCSNPLSVDISATPEYKKEKVVFPSVKDRAAACARHTIMNRLLSQLGGGEQVQPYMLMPYIDQALEMLTTNSSISYELGEKTIHLGQILLDLNKEEELLFGNSK